MEKCDYNPFSSENDPQIVPEMNLSFLFEGVICRKCNRVLICFLQACAYLWRIIKIVHNSLVSSSKKKKISILMSGAFLGINPGPDAKGEVYLIGVAGLTTKPPVVFKPPLSIPETVTRKFLKPFLPMMMISFSFIGKSLVLP